MRKWEALPKEMQIEEVRYYYDILNKKRFSLMMKRFFDVTMSAIMLVMLSPVFLLLAIAIKIDSPGPVFYRQERVTQYGKIFRIHKFRTMVDGADKKGSLVTVNNDSRITRIGHFIRGSRFDEIGQLLDVFVGDMTFVGTRPEVMKYVDKYTPVMLATLLLPAGITSEASILYRNEYQMLDDAQNVDKTYMEKVLPEKMYYNLKSLEAFSFRRDVWVMVRTVLVMLGKNYTGDCEKSSRKLSEREEI